MKVKIERISQKAKVRRTMRTIAELCKMVANPESVPITITLNIDGYAQDEDGIYQRSWFLSDGSVSPIKKR